jgi:hypothetical protein
MIPDTFKTPAETEDPKATTSTENNLPADKPHVGSETPATSRSIEKASWCFRPMN